MDVRLRDIVVAGPVLDRLFSGQPRAKEAFQFALVSRKLTVITAEYNTARGEALKRHATRDETKPDSYHFFEEQVFEEQAKGKARVIDIAALDAYTNEHSELLDTEVGIDFSVTIAQIDKAKIEPPMTPNELAMLWWLIEEFRTEE